NKDDETEDSKIEEEIDIIWIVIVKNLLIDYTKEFDKIEHNKLITREECF
ncbi:5069_t:CDS:2, partial [Gigaspora rosea]